jgi:hypothetical protein
MGGVNEKKTPLDGTELLEFLNAKNTRQSAFATAEDVADFINSFDIPAETLMIILLQEMLSELKHLHEIAEKMDENNKYLRKIYNPQ